LPVLTVRNKQILYIHVPKTGGTSVEQLLQSYGGNTWFFSARRGTLPCSPQHFHGELLRSAFGLTGNKDGLEHPFDFVFMTVRHPISRLLSEYRYRRTIMKHYDQSTQNPDRRQRWAVARTGIAARTLNFDAWCRYALLQYQRNQFFWDNHLRPQADFSVWNPEYFLLEDGLENLRRRLDEVIEVHGSLPNERRKMSIGHEHAGSQLKPSTQRLIKSLYSRDFAEFGYEGSV